MQGHLKATAEKVSLPFFERCSRLHFFEQTPRFDGVRLVQVKLGRAQLRSDGPFWIVKQFGEALERFVSSTQRAEHFRSSQKGVAPEVRISIGGNLSVERQRFCFAMGTGKQLRPPKIRRRTLAQSRIRQQFESICRLIGCDHRLNQLFRDCTPV